MLKTLKGYDNWKTEADISTNDVDKNEQWLDAEIDSRRDEKIEK